MRTLEWAPSVPVNREEVGGNVLLNNGALPLATTHLALTSPLIEVQPFFKASDDVTSWFCAKNRETDAYSRGAML